MVARLKLGILEKLKHTQYLALEMTTSDKRTDRKVCLVTPWSLNPLHLHYMDKYCHALIDIVIAHWNTYLPYIELSNWPVGFGVGFGKSEDTFLISWMLHFNFQENIFNYQIISNINFTNLSWNPYCLCLF